ncbi:MAG TPA: hypothetical protein VMM79_05915 [Longimicrobiales bacterium]|nr:hypothetical protein [Longimicrobiales bacterium]
MESGTAIRTARMLVAGMAALAMPIPGVAQAPIDRLDLHGSLTQGYAVSRDAQLFGVPTDGTLDYGSAALQLRYLLTHDDHLVVQFEHRRLGNSVLSRDAAAVQLDWMFYQRFLGSFDARLGRVPMPQGIFNEVRDIGILLPFYRAPGNFYMEGFEAIDGVVLSYRRPIGAWHIESTVFGGAFDFHAVETSPDGVRLSKQRRRNALGNQFWLETPVRGVRVGLGAVRWDIRNQEGELAAETSWRAAAEAVLGRSTARAEYRAMDHVGHTMVSYYGQAGFNLTDHWTVNAQAEFENRKMKLAMDGEAGTSMPMDPQSGSGMSGTGHSSRELEFPYARDVAFGINYRFAYNLVFKLEAHRASGYNFDDFFDRTGSAGTTDYFIVSVATAF